MAEKFDPYYKWLGIPPRDQPPNHYRLLGIELFEPDRDVIDAAANRVMAYLKDLAVGDEAAHSQRLLNEIARARLCLLNRRKKEGYDRELRAQLAEQTAGEAPPPPRAGGPPPLKPPKSPPPAAPPLAEPPTAEPPRFLTDETSPIAGPPSHDSGSLIDVAATMTAPERIADPTIVSRPRRRARGPSTLHAVVVLVVAACLCLATLALTLLGIGTRDDTPSDKPSAPGRSAVILVLGAQERAEISHFLLDGQPQSVPPRDSYVLAPGSHHVVLRRPGYLDVADSFELGEATRHVIRVRWETRPRNAPASGTPPVEKKTSPAPPRELPKLDLNFGAPSAQEKPARDSRLVAHWAFDGSLVEATDSIATTHWTGQPQFVAGKNGQALLLRAHEPVACETTLIEQALQMTLAFWIKLDRAPEDGESLFEFNRCRLVCRGQVVLIELGQATDQNRRKKRPLRLLAQGWRPADAVDRWVHWSFVYSSPDRRAQYYQDARVVGTQRFVIPAQVHLDQIRIGQFDGALDDLHVFAAALNDTEITSLYASEPGSTDGSLPTPSP